MGHIVQSADRAEHLDVSPRMHSRQSKLEFNVDDLDAVRKSMGILEGIGNNNYKAELGTGSRYSQVLSQSHL